jgi:hypothetical protein
MKSPSQKSENPAFAAQVLHVKDASLIALLTGVAFDT